MFQSLRDIIEYALPDNPVYSMLTYETLPTGRALTEGVERGEPIELHVLEWSPSKAWVKLTKTCPYSNRTTTGWHKSGVYPIIEVIE